MQGVSESLPEFLQASSEVFKSSTHSCFKQAVSYVKGLFRSPKGQANCQAMESMFPDGKNSRSQNLNHMLTKSPWGCQELFTWILNRSLQLLTRLEQPVFLLIDEVGFIKKGDESACVGRQYLGCIKAKANGQVAVAAALSASEYYCPVLMKLFMPPKWKTDQERRKKTGIPPQETHRSKPLMALDMIQSIWKVFPALECVVFDALYGVCGELLVKLIEQNISFVGDIRDNTLVYLKCPEWKVPAYSGRGRRPKKKCPSEKPIKVRSYFKTLTEEDFTRVAFRAGTKGMVQARFHRKKVWMLDEKSANFIQLDLLIRKDVDDELRYSWCYFNREVTLEELAMAQGQRGFVERGFEEGKNIVGMGDYQVRSWDGFHRHMSLCCLALLFLMEQKIKLKPSIGRVTAYQLQELVNATIEVITSLPMIIQRVTHQILQYHRQIEYQLLKCQT